MTPWEQHPQWVENDLYLDFSGAQSATKLDSDDHGLSHKLKSVDFVVEWSDQLWLVEIKDPENGKIPASQKQEQKDYFCRNMISGQLIQKHLFPKLRDSLLYLSINSRIPSKPLKYLVLIALESLPAAELGSVAHTLRGTAWLSGPRRGWQKPFDIHCLNIAQWNRHIPRCPITRISRVHQ